MTSRKVSHYFDEHSITIVSSAPLADILNNPRATGQVAGWNIELSLRDLQFKHPTTIKAQVLPDFLVEWTEVQTPAPLDMSNSWMMFFDGSKRQQGAGAGVVLVSPKERAQICPPDQLQQCLQQRSRVRGTTPWHAHGKNLRRHSPLNLW